MMEKITLSVKKNPMSAGPIYLDHDFSGLVSCMEPLAPTDKKICVVTDSNVGPMYADQVVSLLKDACKECVVYTIPAGEEHKTLDEIQKLYRFLMQNRFERRDLLAALGGGMIGDMTGFAAATYIRGLSFIQIPTTLLAQVDSSIGGKTAVDLDQYKNLVGAFHMPAMVYSNLSALKTLPSEQFASGMGEIVKHGLIRDAAYYEWMISNMFEIENQDPDVMMHLIRRSCEIKRDVVEKDPTEKGERMLLNFGHTIGHSIEKLKNFTLPHGQCVSLGMIAAAHISWQRQLLSSDEFYEIRDMNVGFGLPASFTGLSPEEILETARYDKKASGGQLRFVLLKKIGKAFTDTTVTDEEILAAIRSIDADLD